jgi:hypothetical protein
MPSDRYGNIRINPDENTVTPDGHDGLVRTDHDGINPPAEQGPDILFQRRASRKAEKREFPFKPGRMLLWIAIPLFLVLLYGVGSYFLVPSLIKGPVAGSLSVSFDRPVQVKRIVFSPFSLRVFATDITIGPVYGDEDKHNLLECSGISFRVDFAALFRRQLVCREVKINGVSLNLVRLRSGKFNIADAVHFLSLLKERSGRMTWPAWLVFDGVRLTDGRIIVDDELAGKQHLFEQVSFYFPSAAEARGGTSTLPSLNAMVDSSPVQIDGRQQKDAQGNMETRFTLRFTGIVLQNYLAYLPALQQSPFQLTGGQADVDVDFVIPEVRDDSRKVSVQLTAAVSALHFSDRNGVQVLKVPEARVEVQAFPQARQYIVRNMIFSRPEFTFTLNTKPGTVHSGVSFRDLKNFVQGLDSYPYGILWEKFSWKNGAFRLVYGRQRKSDYSWSNVQLQIAGFSNERFRQQVKKDDMEASFSLKGESPSAGSVMEFSAAGKIRPELQMDGTLAVTSLDLQQYSRFLPVNISFAEGRADLESPFSLTAGSGEQKTGAPLLFRLSEGRLAVRDFIFLNKRRKIISGKRFDCLKLSAEVSGRQLLCGKVLLAQSDIYGDRVRLADMRKRSSGREAWTISTSGLEITSSTLHKQVSNPFDGARPLQLEVKDFSLQVDNLQGEILEKDNLRASGRISRKGKLILSGTYSPVSGRGQLSVSLKNADVGAFKNYVTPWLVPELQGGTISAEGTYMVQDKVFAGTLRVADLQAGQVKGPFVGWQEAVSGDVRIQFDPFLFESGKTVLKQPVIKPGISHADKPVRIFVRPLQDGEVSEYMTIKSVRFEGGTLDLPEPVIAPGYQPKLTGISGTLSFADSRAMPFALQGRLKGQARFTIRGTTGIDRVNDYSLEVSDLPLEPFQTILRKGAGIEADSGVGTWQQDMKRENGELFLANRIRLRNIRPDPRSGYFRALSMYIDDNFSLYYAGEDRPGKEDTRTFLLDTLIRGIQRDAVKADLSEQLILSRLLPELNLAGGISFVPGASKLGDTGSLSAYAELLKRRPFLRLELAGSFDTEADTPVLRKIMQEKADHLREAENRRRAEERAKKAEQEKGRPGEPGNDPGRIVEEKITPVELTRDLQPLPPEKVRVSRENLVELAGKRALAVYDYFVNQLSVDRGRLTVSARTGENGPNVTIAVQPHYSALKKSAAEE